MKVAKTREIAEFFQVTPRQVRNWRKEGAPIGKDGSGDLQDIQRWRDRRRRGDGGGLPSGGGGQQLDLTVQRGRDFQDERLKKGKADLVEMEVRQRRGELVEWGQVEAMFVARIMAVKQGLLSLSRALPPQLSRCREEREMEAIIGRVVRELLESYSRPLPRPAATGKGASSGAETVAESGG